MVLVIQRFGNYDCLVELVHELKNPLALTFFIHKINSRHYYYCDIVGTRPSNFYIRIGTSFDEAAFDQQPTLSVGTGQVH